MKKPCAPVLASLLLAACGDSSLPVDGRAASSAGVDDVVVVAVIDDGFNPYHHDFAAEHMPQHKNTDPSDDLPLDQDPATWLKGHPGAAAFKSYTRLDLTLKPDDKRAQTAALHDADLAKWDKVRYSEGTANADVHMYWIPGTKVIGHVAFSGPLVQHVAGTEADVRSTGPVDTWAFDSHGTGTTSVSVGNLYGTCPSCVFVFVHGMSEEANRWVEQQDWIDVQTNSWGYNFTVGARDNVYAGSDTEAQRLAVERGQTILFSGGNGLGNAFDVNALTLTSSQKGPDWMITVGAIHPGNGSSYSGAGKPVDVASVGSGYPASYTATSTTGNGAFSGTSNATPVVAGIVGETLYRLRRAMGGASRVQAGGVVATGAAGCGLANPDCALADGVLTVHELREALFRGAQYTDTGWNVAGAGPLPETENVAELEFMAEGHGSFRGKLERGKHYEAEMARVTGFADGSWFTEQDPDQKAWMVADALCRQGGWGAWDHGYAAGNEAPAASPDWPVRTWLVEACPTLLDRLVVAERAAHRN